MAVRVLSHSELPDSSPSYELRPAVWRDVIAGFFLLPGGLAMVWGLLAGKLPCIMWPASWRAASDWSALIASAAIPPD